MKRTWIRQALIVNEGICFAGSVVIENEIISEVLHGDECPSLPCDEEIDAHGCYLIPGVIDDHVHFRDPGLTHKADIRQAADQRFWRHLCAGGFRCQRCHEPLRPALQFRLPRL